MLDQPDLILTPFGENAPGGAIDPIPETRSPADPPQRATWSDGFPSVTMQPLASGGIPPRGQDFNGVLNAISQHLAFLGAGGAYRWSDEVAARGGYEKGAVLLSDDGTSAFISTIEGNTINFNDQPMSIGDQWLPYAGEEKADARVSIIAGAGLTGGGSLEQSRALSVDFATPEQAQELTAGDVAITPATLGAALFASTGIQVYDAPGVYEWIVPDALKNGSKKAWVTVVGGGGGGGRSADANGGGSGGAGGVAIGLVSLEGVETVQVTVGAGGNRRTGSNGAGEVGTSSSFGTYMTAGGGSSSQQGRGGGGTAVGGDINLVGGSGTQGSASSGNGGDGGSNHYAQGGVSPEQDGLWPGGGGSGGPPDQLGGHGADGMVLIQW